ncbi:hypothetical protein NM688_g5117 [Phlebia brevispora]|uniref:Uncharacterized protein n=1 Tax=Phlebia brevispora TaxID=194682 RepID=A0ACC1T0I8_9APHY|nr:hypothetical protein NM688_g5117 [Phlebia brevispora]
MAAFPPSPARAAWALLFALTIPALVFRRYLRRRRRAGLVQHVGERVLVLGGSSGIGRALSLEYVQRGAKVFIVGLRQSQIDSVYAECTRLYPRNGNVIAKAADFTNVEAMLEVRQQLKEGRLLSPLFAGVAATRPLLEVAGVARNGSGTREASAEGISRAVEVSNAALRANYTGPLVSAVTFIPLLEESSRSPAILLIASLGSVVPAPTRSIYCSTKSASLILYQSLAIEHRKIAFTFALPSTVEGNFRASAVDDVGNAEPVKQRALKREVVAQRCIAAIDHGEKVFFMPSWYGRLGHTVYWLCPSVAEYFAARRYGFA